MKIIHVSTATTWRGGEQQIVYLIESLRQENVEQTIFCPTGSPLSVYCIENGFEIILYKKRNSLGLHGSKLLARFCKKYKEIIVHVHDSHAHTLVFLSSVIFRNNVPIIVHRRVDFPAGKSFFSKIKYNYSGIKRYICVSEAIRNILTQSLKKPDKAIVIYDGVDLDKFLNSTNTNHLRKEFGLKPEHIIVGNVSALADHKDYPTFIRTAAILCQSDDRFRFVIMGEGSLRNELEDLMSQLNLQNKVILAGFRTNIPILLKELDVFLMPSKTEGLGSSILDAFACKIPVVSTYAGGIPELIDHEHSGMLANVGDAPRLAQHILRIIGDDAFRQSLITNAYNRVAMFNFRQTARYTLDVYNQIQEETKGQLNNSNNSPNQQ